MERKKRFGHLIITYTIILLLPVVVIGLLLIFFYLGKLEKNFEELNTKAIETANVQLDMLMEDVLTIDYQLSLNAEVHSFLTREFSDTRERVLLLQDVRDSISDSLVNRDGIVGAVLYSQINDVFVGHTAAFDWQGLMERYFAKRKWAQEELAAILEEVGARPVWLVSGEYIICCNGITTAGYSGEGCLLVVVSKQTLLDTWTEVLGSLETECAIIYRGQEILLQTEDFDNTVYYADKLQDRIGDQVVKYYASRKMGSLTYVYAVDNAYFGGGVNQAIQNLVLVSIAMIAISFFLAKRKAKHIRTMYEKVLEENETLEDQLNEQVEELNTQLLKNALHGYERLPSEKQNIFLKGSNYRVLIFRFLEDEMLHEQKEFCQVAERYLKTTDVHFRFLFERNVGYICLLDYKAEDALSLVLKQLQEALVRIYGTGICMGLSTMIQEIESLSDAYEQAGIALHYGTVMHQNGGLVSYSDISEFEKEKMYYPPEKEQQLMRNIRMGMRDEVEKFLERVYQINFRDRRLSKDSAWQLHVKMLNTAYELIDVVYSNDIQEYDQISRSLLVVGKANRSFESIRDILLTMCDKCAERKESDLRKQIVAYIGENFKDQDLSLEKMAADFKISYYHLSRLFNEYMQMNFSSYLAGLRLDYSTELLRTTNLSVEQVAQRAGFLQSSSFIRVFKKYYGVTPGKYREERSGK